MNRRLIGGLVALMAVSLAWGAELDSVCYKTSGDGTNDWEYHDGVWQDDSDGKFKGLILMTFDFLDKDGVEIPTIRRVDEYWFWKEGSDKVVGHWTHTAGTFQFAVTETGHVVLYRRSGAGFRKDRKAVGGVTAAMFIGRAEQDGPPKCFTGVHLDIYDNDELDMETSKLRLEKKMTEIAREGLASNPGDVGSGAEAIEHALMDKGYIFSK